MQFDTVFQYLFAWKGEIYQDHIFFAVPFWKKFLWKIGFVKELYTKDQLDQAEQVILSGAMKSLDALIERTEKKNQKFENLNHKWCSVLDGVESPKLIPVEV